MVQKIVQYVYLKTSCNFVTCTDYEAGAVVCFSVQLQLHSTTQQEFWRVSPHRAIVVLVDPLCHLCKIRFNGFELQCIEHVEMRSVHFTTLNIIRKLLAYFRSKHMS